jgi:peptidoglycan/LPS O-acetylase OafA/YrhL
LEPPAGWARWLDLFFVLSGFLITTLLLEERAEAGQVSLRAFYARRARRLFPALTTLLLAYSVVVVAKGGDPLATVTLGGLYAGNLVQAFGLDQTVFDSPLAHLWSLAQEEQFYLVWPWLLVPFARRPRRLAALIGLLVCYRIGLTVAGAGAHRIDFAPDTRADGLLAGARSLPSSGAGGGRRPRSRRHAPGRSGWRRPRARPRRAPPRI